MTPITATYRTSSSRGRARARCSAGLTDSDVAGLGYFRFRPEEVEVGGVPAWVSRTGYSGELGYEIFKPASTAPRISGPS